jgi:hypothetical protein
MWQNRGKTVFEITENIELMRVCGYSCNPSGITTTDFLSWLKCLNPHLTWMRVFFIRFFSSKTLILSLIFMAYSWQFI